VDRQNRIRLLTGLMVLMLLFFVFTTFQEPTDRIPYSEFKEAVAEGRVESVTIVGQNVEGQFVDDEPFSTVIPPELVVGREGHIERMLEEHEVAIDAEVEADGIWGFVLLWTLPLLIFIGFIWYMNRQARGQMGPLGQVGKSKAKVYKPHEPTTRFDDVAGYREVKEEVQEVVAFLRDPDRFRKAGAEIPKGMLLDSPMQTT
jgi:cell division protease FtsH